MSSYGYRATRLGLPPPFLQSGALALTQRTAPQSSTMATFTARAPPPPSQTQPAASLEQGAAGSLQQGAGAASSLEERAASSLEQRAASQTSSESATAAVKRHRRESTEHKEKTAPPAAATPDSATKTILLTAGSALATYLVVEMARRLTGSGRNSNPRRKANPQLSRTAKIVIGLVIGGGVLAAALGGSSTAAADDEAEEDADEDVDDAALLAERPQGLSIPEMNLAPEAKAAALALVADPDLGPYVVFTSGRRSWADQARIDVTQQGAKTMNAHNAAKPDDPWTLREGVVAYIAKVHRASTVKDALLGQLGAMPLDASADDLRAAMLDVFSGFSDAELFHYSRHPAGYGLDYEFMEAGKLANTEDRVDAAKDLMAEQPGFDLYLDAENGLVVNHVQFTPVAGVA